LQSLLNVMKKELSQTLRDRRMLATLIVSPILQLVVFGYAIDLDVDRIPTVVCDQDRTPQSRELTQAFFADRTFLRTRTSSTPTQAQDALEAGGAAAALIVPRGFAAARRARGCARGSGHRRRNRRHARAGRVERGEPVLALARDRRRVEHLPAVAAASLVPRVMYNQRLKSAVYMLPGVLATLLLNVTAIVTAMGLARERETGTLEQVLVTPIRSTVLLAGKCLPYILFGFIDVLAILLLGNRDVRRALPRLVRGHRAGLVSLPLLDAGHRHPHRDTSAPLSSRRCSAAFGFHAARDASLRVHVADLEHAGMAAALHDAHSDAPLRRDHAWVPPEGGRHPRPRDADDRADGSGIGSSRSPSLRFRKRLMGPSACQAFGQLGTTHLRHHDIGEKEIDRFRMLLAKEQGLSCVLGRDDAIPLTTKDGENDRTDLLLVLDEQRWSPCREVSLGATCALGTSTSASTLGR
jgi:hypothetical protein